MFPATPVIDRLRVRSQGREANELRRALSAQLASAEVGDLGISPSSILLIRRLDDPLPRGLSATVNGHLSAHWNWAFNDSLRQVARSAERPQGGRVSSQASAVLFADEAEFLACLALDLGSAGDPASWWRQAVARFLRQGSLRALLLSRVRLLPAAFALLGQWRSLESVVEALDAEAALGLCAAFATENDLRPVLRLLELSGRNPSASTAEPAWGVTGEGPGTDTRELTIAEPSQPGPQHDRGPLPRAGSHIDAWIPAACERLGIAQRLLIAIVLGFRSAPAQFAQPGLAVELRRWLMAQSRRPASPCTAELPRPPTPTRSDEEAEPFAAEAGASVPKPTAPEIGFGTGTTATDHLEEDRRQSPELAVTKAEAEADADADATFDGFETRLAGIFYLINVMENLGLPECFEERCRLASSVGAFGTLEALARAFASGDLPQHDGIWSVLATLDGREPHAPPRAEGLRPPGRDLPPLWLKPINGSDLSLREPERATIEALRRAAWPPALLDWLKLVTPFIGWRIARACALDEVDEALRLLIELPARVYVTASHIDVVTSIENIRVPVRLAGLDRSPGWVRSLQRVVLFHFE